MTWFLLIPVAGAAAAAGAPAAGLLAPLPDLAASTSDLTTRPFGPEPAMPERSIPASLARRFASGEANTRPPSDFAGALAAAAGALEPVLAFGAGAAVFGASGAAAGAALGASAFGAVAATALASSPSCSSTAM